MTDTDSKPHEIEDTKASTTIVAQVTTEAPRSDLNQVLADFPENRLVIQQTTDAPSPESQTFELHSEDEEILLKFHENCVEDDILLDIKRLSQQ